MRVLIVLLFAPLFSIAQAPMTSFSSLGIPSSSRGWGMGNTGIASSVENQGLSYNVATVAFAKHLSQASVFYMPWLPRLTTDARFVHADYLGSVSDGSALGVSVNYLNLGTVALRDDNGATLGLYRANEFNIGTSYALQLGSSGSLGSTLRFFGNMMPAGVLKNTYSVCGDLGYYQSAALGDASGVLSWGAVVSNLGANRDLPTTAGVGLSYTKHDEAGNRLMVSLDASRLLRDDFGGVQYALGGEYVFDQSFALRGGVHLENALRGGRKYFSIGAGYKGFVGDEDWGIDVHYLVPFGTTISAFQNVYGFTLALNMRNFQ